MWSEQSAKDKQPYEQKAAKLKEKYEKVSGVLLASRAWLLNQCPAAAWLRNPSWALEGGQH